MYSDFAPSIEILEDNAVLWWLGTVTFFLAGDILTTLVGLQMHTIVESSPVAAWLIKSYGLPIVIPFKVLVVGGFYAFYRLAPRPHRIGVPLGLCALGFVVTVWNGAVIVAAVL